MSVGDIMNTPENVQYTGEFSVHWKDTTQMPGTYHDEWGRGYHGYKGGCLADQGFHTNSVVSSMTFPT